MLVMFGIVALLATLYFKDVEVKNKMLWPIYGVLIWFLSYGEAWDHNGYYLWLIVGGVMGAFLAPESVWKPAFGTMVGQMIYILLANIQQEYSGYVGANLWPVGFIMLPFFSLLMISSHYLVSRIR